MRQEYETHIPRQNFENQAIQFVTTPVGLLSRFGFTVGGIPVGHLLYMLLGPIGEVRQIRYKRQYADLLARNYGESYALTKRYRKLVAEEITAWNNLRIGNWGKIEFYKSSTPTEGAKMIFGYEVHVVSREEMIEEQIRGKTEKPNLAFAIPNATQFIGYYVKTVPIQLWEVSKNFANWIARKTAYHTYKVYQGIDEDLKRSAKARAESDAVGERYRQLMTVQTEGNRPHPKQVSDGIMDYHMSACRRLFQ